MSCFASLWRCAVRVCAALLLTSPLFAQTSAVVVAQSPNSWTSGAPIPVAVIAPNVGALNIGGLKGQINVIGGWDGSNGFTVYDYNQIYYPTSNTWGTGAALPTANYGGAVGVANNVLYLFGGTPDGTSVTNAVWAYDPKTDSWSPRSAMPTARVVARAVVQNSIIYVIGGQDANFIQLATVESYNPATDTWTVDAPMPVAKSLISAGALGTRIVAADGRTGMGDPGDTESYSLATASWSTLTPDPTGRDNSCAGAIGATQLYVAGGRVPGGVGTPALDLNESFKIVNNAWTMLASMPQRTQGPGSTVYSGRLYCFGGQASQGSQVALSNVQIYQP
jgi:hypothetical protein